MGENKRKVVCRSIQCQQQQKAANNADKRVPWPSGAALILAFPRSVVSGLRTLGLDSNRFVRCQRWQPWRRLRRPPRAHKSATSKAKLIATHLPSADIYSIFARVPSSSTESVDFFWHFTFRLGLTQWNRHMTTAIWLRSWTSLDRTIFALINRFPFLDAKNMDRQYSPFVLRYVTREPLT